jgi:hypothetical protein
MGVRDGIDRCQRVSELPFTDTVPYSDHSTQAHKGTVSLARSGDTDGPAIGTVVTCCELQSRHSHEANSIGTGLQQARARARIF